MLQKYFSTVAVVVLLARGGFSQCYTNTGCTGEPITAADKRECCVGTNDGLAYLEGGDCMECVVHGFLSSIYDVSEDGRLDTTFQLNVKGTTSLPLNLAGTVTAAAAGTASDGDFGQLAPIPVRDNVAEIRLFTTNDEITLEYDDRVLLTFIPANPVLIPGIEGTGEFVRATATVNIIDNDLLNINFEESDYVTPEASSMLSSIIRLQFRETQNPFTITLYPANVGVVEGMGLGRFINAETIVDTARATTGEDFTDDKTTIEVPERKRSHIIPNFFRIINDNVDEDDQSFAIVAELGVPERFGCFQTKAGEPDCFGQRGATEIRIMDNDPMIIGFTQRDQTICENGIVPINKEDCFNETGVLDLFPLNINVSTLRTAEREHGMIFRYLESSSTATIEALNIQFNPMFDATFGTRNDEMMDDPLEQRLFLLASDSLIPPLLTVIRNDFISEMEECYTIAIFPVDVAGRRELFICNRSPTAMNYFCEHTICICNDDDPFVVAFVETEYTVDESAGSVEVCVQLLRPKIDIDRENVTVFVDDDPTSVYIPSGAILATPDVPDFLGKHLMVPRTDYAQQTKIVNDIDSAMINQTMRIVCYNQPIYDDLCLEPREYAGLTLGVAESTVLTVVEPLYDHAAILILDDDEAVVGLEQTDFTVKECVGTVELCAIVYSPNINCPIKFDFNVSLFTFDDTAESPMDYVALQETLTFSACVTRRCVDVSIVCDSVSEGKERFGFSLRRVPGMDPRITLNPVDGHIVITEIGPNVTFVNDTLTGDPLLTVPIWTDPNVAPGDDVQSLCYEVHGEDGAYFNLISDECTSVNSYYQTASTPSPNIDLNVVTQIGVRAVGNNDCWDIQVNLDSTCSATVNGTIPLSTHFDGITVKRYPTSSRVRISVPNCADTQLVMWVFCRKGEVEDPMTWVNYNIDFLRFFVTRGLNLNEESHGLIGQFWNVPVTVEPYEGLFNGAVENDDFIITVNHPSSEPRSFVGVWNEVTWEFEKRGCYYVGNKQAGELAEVAEPNDPVIEGEYSQYKVNSLFSTGFTFSHFSESRCQV